jgi:cytochrome bd ubiquinol oxidase subunit I
VIGPPGIVAYAAPEAQARLFGPGEQHHVVLARELQTLSFAAHIPLVCFAISFPAMVLFVEWLHQRTGDPVYRVLAQRWSKVMLALFAVGVVTGTILSFELGLLWPVFMARFASVFGLAFALEGFAFFTEAIFIALYVYGWGRLHPRLHLLAGVPVAIAGVIGSTMVIAVNAWMNHPTGFTLRDGNVVDVHPWHALFGNPYLWHELVHMYLAGYLVAGFLLAGVYAWGWLHGRRDSYQRTALLVPLAVAAFAAPAQIVVGDWAGRAVAKEQPVKLAAFEGLARTSRGAPVHIAGWYDGGKVVDGIEIPRLLSFLAYHDPNATVAGLDTVPPADRPPVNLVRIAFQVMVAAGLVQAAVGLAFLVGWIRRRRLPEAPLFYWSVIAAGALSLVALYAGWVTTEVGRQPWVVYERMRTSDAVTAAAGIPVAFGALLVVYLGLAGATLWILRRLAREPREVAADPRSRGSGVRRRTGSHGIEGAA